MKRIAILASGGGSNAKKFLEHFKQSNVAQIALIVTNSASAGVLTHAKDFNVPALVWNKNVLTNPEEQLAALKQNQIDFVVLAGYLKQIPELLVREFPNGIFNIHPALLPHYGGKGMYGMNVHKAVKANNEKFSGPTIHLVNEEYDKGEILFQAKVELSPDDSAESIAKKVLTLEHKHYASVVEQYIQSH